MNAILKVRLVKVHLILFLLPFLFSSCKKEVKTAKPTTQPLVEAVYASGSIVPFNEYKVFALSEGFLLEKKVEVGSRVSKGQTLFYPSELHKLICSPG